MIIIIIDFLQAYGWTYVKMDNNLFIPHISRNMPQRAGGDLIRKNLFKALKLITHFGVFFNLSKCPLASKIFFGFFIEREKK